MKIIVPLIKHYNSFFESPEGLTTIKSFNENERLLFQAVLANKVETDVQASKLLYDGNPSSQSYMKFKQSLYPKLIKMLINMEINVSHFNVDKKLRLLRESHAVRLLSNLSPTTLTRALMKKVLLKAERMQMYDIAAMLSQSLSYDSKTHLKNVREGDVYWDKYLHYSAFEDARIRARNAYADISKYTRKQHLNQELSQRAEQSAAELKKILHKENTRAFRYYYQLKYLQYILIGEHQHIIENNQEAIDYLLKYDRDNDGIDTLRIQIAISYFNLNMYDKAITYLDDDINPAEKRWILKVSLKARGYFLKDKFQEASYFMNSIVSLSAFKGGRKSFKEKVWLYKYYAELMIGINENKPINARQIKNNLTRTAVDKKGQNIPLFFANLINEILKSGPEILYKERERIEMYYTSHLKPSKNKRAMLFAKFLILLPEEKYNRQLFRKKLMKLKDDFKKNPLKDVIQPDNEFVNYEKIIARLLDQYVPNQENVFQSVRKETLRIQEAVV